MKKKLASKNNAAVAADMEQTIVQGINCTNFTCNFASVGSTAPAPRVLQVLADFVSSGAEVEHVYISEMESLAPLCDALAASPFLSELFLAHASCISVHKLPAEVARIAKGSASLRELTIYDSIVGAAWKSVLPEVLSGRFLTSLVFSQCRLGDNNTEIIASAFSSGQRGLTDLDLSNNCIAETGSKAIAAGIITRTPLRTLNLYANMIGDTGAAAIGETLANPYCVLRKLNLGQNGVSPVGIKPLAKALRQNSQLEKLVLGPNDLGDAGAELLAEALSRGTRSCLRRLDLRANVITEAGARRIAEMGLQPRGLEKLNLRENSVGVDGSGGLRRAHRCGSWTWAVTRRSAARAPQRYPGC